MDAAAEHGHLAVVKWLHENRTEGCSTAAMDLAAANNHLEVLQWLHNNRKEGCTSDAFHFAAIYGHLQIIQWLHHNNLVQSAAHGEIDALELAAEHGHLTVVQWLLDHGYGGQKSLELAMRFAAANGHVRIVEFLHKQEGQPLQPEDFLVASSNGQLEVVMYSWQHCDWRHNMTSTCGSSGSAALDVLDAALEQATAGGHSKVLEYLQGQRHYMANSNDPCVLLSSGRMEVVAPKTDCPGSLMLSRCGDRHMQRSPEHSARAIVDQQGMHRAVVRGVAVAPGFTSHPS
eukprot:TRINITY_DN2324_c0_g1_i3.p1 TRINITY_DN2324_c0_g1~~TRINITY_DN2324_c0_g1_i3.p1  ORF type:complete len:288 (-),score=39.14 TRINITY_DN2324_c0_g1_i3:467-1330(-)